MHVADHLGVITGHANADALVECPEPRQDDLVREDLEEEGEEVQRGADVGVVGHHVPSGRVNLSQRFKQLRKPRQLDINICTCTVTVLAGHLCTFKSGHIPITARLLSPTVYPRERARARARDTSIDRLHCTQTVATSVTSTHWAICLA